MKKNPDRSKQDLPARERILLTAHDLFYMDGVRATGIDKIIAESGVTKVTFYRHFPSKDDLIRAFLAYRHERWLTWFKEAVARHGSDVNALPKAMHEWFSQPDFRGCAFLNSVSELSGVLPEVRNIALAHKNDVAAVIESLLPDSAQRHQLALTLCIAMDGAITRASFDVCPENAELALASVVRAIAADIAT
ncbi:TetR/AcrR family transcriptional regulator [Pandoraea pnomenusa]|uniref:TetR/AcrR family transcriptional regulator n=1 Tax=Pandoraea pnomenusa TaxID=93220 RepID=UPI0033424D99